MSNKLALILTGIWTLLVLAGCGGAFWFVGTQVPRNQQDERARMLGTGIGTVSLIGYAAIGIPWASAWAKHRKERAAENQQDEDDEPPPPPRRKRPRPQDE